MTHTISAPHAPKPTRAPKPPGRRPMVRAHRIQLGAVSVWLSFCVLLPVIAVCWQSTTGGPQAFWSAVTSEPALEALRVTLTVSAIAALINGVFGLLVAWVLVRDDFPAKRILDALIDMPFALPTIVASLVLLSLYGPHSPVRIHLQNTQLGIGVALLFVTLPFVVRSVQPVLLTLDPLAEEAAISLGASNATVFRKIILPALVPSLLAGVGQAFSRAVGEFGSVVLIGGDVPGKTEVASQWIRTLIEHDDRTAAAAVSVVLMLISFVLLATLRAIGSKIAPRQVSGL